ncbi:signal peptide peptidase SppA [Gaoshiqia sediminis]|uniref:Signal peptide peptidase SppA n=1 Tax=Gaoshiqia sediminis TaxID=2986998 RepID=A0AA41Y9D5_9BACT|nr:signal peptide peptidase SppA [Gaoshiqia sediminis]MCW0484001.1 signal peptide peptidase SppA [Gaoshiqia sediminis]
MKDFLKFTLASVIGVLLAGFVGMLLLIVTFSAILSLSEQPVDVKDKTLLMLKLDHKIVERSDKNPLNDLELPGISGPRQTGLDDILACIEKAKTDDRIRGIYLNPSEIDAGLATLEEIRHALADFKESGKFVYAYGEAWSQKAFYLVSVADKVVLNPKGMIDFKGLSAQRSFFKKALEKVGVEVQVIRHGKFKAAVEPFMLEKMSPENRLQTETYMGSIWNQLLADISASRQLSIDELNDLADGVTTFQRADYLMAQGLVDTLLYKDEVINDLKELTSIRENSDLRVIDVKKYAQAPVKTDGKGLARDKIAVIYANGDIGMGTDGSGTGIDPEEISRTIREARRDSSIKAIVLRINSPGGSAYGSEVIWREVKLAAETKPVIASMSDVAASGGYYIAAAAHTIMADRTTITGSIGIFGLIPNAGELLNDKLGITQDVVNTNEHSDILSLTRKLTDFELELLQNYIEDGYDTFIGRVAEGRKMTKEEVDAIGQGRVWSAENALDNRLIDLYGGVNDAIKLAADMSETERYRVIQLPKIKDPLEEWLKELSGTARMRLLKSELGDHYPIYKQLKSLTRTRGILTRLPYDIQIN